MLSSTARRLLVALTATAACAGTGAESGTGADGADAGREVAIDVLIDDARGVEVVAIYPIEELSAHPALEPSLRWQLEAGGDPIASGTFADPRLLRPQGGPALRSSFGIAALRVPERAGELVILDGDAELGRAALDPAIGMTRSPLLRAGDVRGGPVRILGDLERATAVDVLVLPEGYTAAQLGRFRRDALQIARAFRAVISSQRRLGGRFNIWVQDVRSRSSGIDDPAGHRIADTAFDVGFGDGDGRRCTFFHTPAGLATARQLGRMAGADVVIVLAHTAEHGGCADPGVVVMTHGRWAPWVMAHELGHALVGLADEYEAGGGCRHDAAPNIAFSTDRGRIPWGRQVSPLVPLPTPETATYAGALGAFTGAQYCATGAFRPQLTCLMRDLGRGFCRVCLGRVDRVVRTIARGGRAGGSPGGGDGEHGCGNRTCDGDETDATCPADCGCAAGSCGVAPYGCYCDQGCRQNGDCCADACDACGSC